MARFKFSQIFKSTATHLSGDERPDFAAVETLLGSKSEDEAVSDQQRQVATERLLRRWKFATYAMAFILCFLSITLSSLLRKQHGHPVRQIFCEPASSSVDKGRRTRANVPSAPAEAAIEYKEVVFHNNFHEDRTPYQGPPTDEVDKAWNDLYSSMPSPFLCTIRTLTGFKQTSASSR